MEQKTIIGTFETSTITNIWVERNHLISFLITGGIGIYAQFNLIQIFEAFVRIFLFTGILC